MHQILPDGTITRHTDSYPTEERPMRLGFTVPLFGEDAGPDAIQAVARQAEDLGYDSLWVFERLLYPVNPQVPYPGTADGSLPLIYRRAAGPLAIFSDLP